MIWILLIAWTLCILWVGSWFGLWKFCMMRKDGGLASRVMGFWLFECKQLFSVALLRFDPGWREVFHSHAFNSVSWILGPGKLREEHVMGYVQHHKPAIKPVMTYRGTFHRVFAYAKTWVITFRGPWANVWYEYDEATKRTIQLTHGRAVVWSNPPEQLA